MIRPQVEQALRRAAEALLTARPAATHLDAEAGLAPLQHELQVHQIELEIQNSELRAARAELEAALDRYSDLYDSAPVAYVSLDRNGVILQINLAGATLLASSREQLVGRAFSDFVARAAQADFARLLAHVATHPERCELTLAGGRDGRSPLPVEMVIACAGETLRAVLTDISERLAGERARSEAALRTAELSRHLLCVQDDTRRRLAGALHDHTSPNLAAMAINLEMTELALQAMDRDQVALRLSDIRALIEDTAASVREICTDLYPPALAYGGLLPALQAYAEQFTRRCAIPVQLTGARPVARLAPEVESALFRIAQEALTNAAKHSQANALVVELRLAGPSIRLSVSDDGIGFDPAHPDWRSGQGIVGMRELAGFLGARFALCARPGAGTRVEVEIP